MKLIVFLLITFLAVNQVFSQKKTLDLSVIPLTPDTVLVADSLQLLIQFKINHPDSVQSLQLKFGTGQNLSDIAQINPLITGSDTTWFVSFNGEQNQISNYEAKVYHTLSQAQAEQYLYLTLTVVYIDNTADILYWLKQTPQP